MRVIKDGQVVDDSWQFIADGEPVPEGDVIVTHGRWQQERAALSGRPGRLGIRIDATLPVAVLAPDCAHFALIALQFAQSGDGRPYSQAMLLRQRHGYRGELRALGEVLRDQLLFMHRCGIDSFALRADQDADAAIAALSEFSLAYQPAADDTPVVASYRRSAAER